MSLLAHDLKIVHRPGSQNHAPDALSRAFESYVCAANEASPPDHWYQNQVSRVQKFPDKYPDWKFQDGRLFVHRPCDMIDALMPDLDSWKLVVPAWD